MSGEIQYIADTILIEKIAKLEDVLTKEAQMGDVVGQIFSGVGSAVSSFVKANVDSSSPGALAKSVLGLLAPGMLFRVHPLLSFVYYIAKEYGYDITGIIKSVTDKISDKIKSGEQIDPSEINQAAITATASINTDLLYELRKLEKTGSFIKMAQRSRPLGGKFFGQKGAPILHNLFGFLPKKSGQSLLAGIVAWFIKTILLSAGLLTIGGAANTGAKKLVEKGSDIIKTPDPLLVSNTGQEAVSEENISKLQSHDSYIWYVPILGGNVKNTILEWAKEFYPDLSGYEDIILKTPSFNNIVNEMSRFAKGPYLVLPSTFKSREDIAKRFVPDIQKEIKNVQEA